MTHEDRFDALAFGVRKDVAPQEAADGCPVGSQFYNAQLFELRDNSIPKVAANYEPYIARFLKGLMLRFRRFTNGIWGANTSGRPNANDPTAWTGSLIELECTMLYTLLDGSLTIAEQNAQQFWIAKVVSRDLWQPSMDHSNMSSFCTKLW